MSDIVEKTTASEITFTAMTERAQSWMRDYCGTVPTVTYRLLNRDERAAEFRRLAKSKELKITPIR
ncbi:MAG TPA: hypothetical protein VJN43_05585 [Bryobacteraceae bacterium]|nr:hypothetical protein [Bryobacteraceae bacterium]